MPIVIGESQGSFSLSYHSANHGHSNEHTEVVERPSGGDLYRSTAVVRDRAVHEESEGFTRLVPRSRVPHGFLLVLRRFGCSQA
jgi:hypothetical protein